MTHAPLKSEPILPVKKATWLDRLYFVGVIIKGFDGAVEFAAGMFLWLWPAGAHWLLQTLAAEAGEKPGHVRQFTALYLADADDRLAHTTLTFLIIYLIVHAIVKLGLFYCLIRRIHQAYPTALAILVVFTGYQVYEAIIHPSFSLWGLTIFDIVIIWLVWREYKELAPESAKRLFHFQRHETPN